MREEQARDENIQRIWTTSRGQAISSPTYQEIQDVENLSEICGFIVKEEVPTATGEIRKKNCRTSTPSSEDSRRYT